jgi:hypothetical protein
LLLHVKILGSKEFLDILERSCQIYTKRTHAWRLEHLLGFLIISQICPGLRSLVKIHEYKVFAFLSKTPKYSLLGLCYLNMEYPHVFLAQYSQKLVQFHQDLLNIYL